MPTPRDVTQDTDPASEPDDAGTALLKRRPVDGTAESLYTAEKRHDPLDEYLGHTGELSKPQGRAEVENRANRRHAVVDKPPLPRSDGTWESPDKPDKPEKPEKPTERANGHEGATEGQVTTVPAPAGKAFEDEPKQG